MGWPQPVVPGVAAPCRLLPLLAVAHCRGWPQPVVPAGGRPLQAATPVGGRPLQGAWPQPVAPLQEGPVTSLHCIFGQLGLFLRSFIFEFEVFFRWFDVLILFWYDHEESSLFAVMFSVVGKPQWIRMERMKEVKRPPL
ncbi:hypothetical protein GW17_00049741 [Ensete ventricosum]|nr:hypothetical protein GW17_00049741 [Ensete ventricosum]